MTFVNSTEFSQLARELAPAFKVVHRTWIAVRHGISWEVRYCRILFGTFPPPELATEINIETASVRAHRFVELLSDPTGEVESALADPYKSIEAELGSLFRGESGLTTTFHRFYPPEYPGAQRWPTLRVEAPRLSGQGTTETLKLELELLSHSTPYDGLTDVYEEFGLPAQFTADTSGCVTEIILSPVCEIDVGSELRDGLLRMSVRAAAAIIPEQVSIGVKAFGRTGIRRYSVRGDSFTWDKSSSPMVGTVESRLEETPMVLTTLSYRGEHLHRWWIRDETRSYNQLLDLHRAVDPSGGLSQDDFFDQKNDFEERAGLLLSLLRLRTLKYGQIPKLTDAPDILALSDSGHLYVVECTTGDVNAKGKLQRLAERSQGIAQALNQSDTKPTHILPMIVTSLPRSQTVAHHATAHSLGIAILSREKIIDLIGRVATPPAPDTLFTELSSLVPAA